MAATFDAAVAQVRALHEEAFDAAIGLTRQSWPAAPVPVDVAAVFAPLDSDFYERLARGIARRYSFDPVRTEDAQQDALLELLRKRPELYREDPRSWVPLLVVKTRYRLKALLSGASIASIESMEEASPGLALGGSARLVAEVHSGRETDRREPPPLPGEPWTMAQVIGALQRFRDYHGRPPKTSECRAANGLPSMHAIRRHFGRFSDAVLAAGMVPEHQPSRTNPWRAREAAEVCLSFRRRRSHWPNWADAKRYRGELPGTGAMIRFFGGTRSCDVQRGVELILRVRS